MKAKTIKIMFNLIIAFTITLILLSAVIPKSIYAGISSDYSMVEDSKGTIDNIDDQYTLQQEKILRKKIVDNLPEERKSQIDMEELNDYIDNARKDSSYTSDGKPNVTDEAEYKNWLEKDIIPGYLNYYKPFNQEQGNDYRTDKEKQDAFNDYTYSKVEEEQGLQGEKTEEQERQVENAVGEITGENGTLVTELTDEEKKRADEILKLEDHGWWQTLYGWAEDILNWFKDIPEKLAGEIIDFVCGIGDAVVNTLQEIMLPGSPKAVAERRPTTLFKRILGERGLDAFIYAFVEKTGGTYRFGTAQEPVSLIYYGPGAIFSNKIPTFDVNFIDSSKQIGNPFVTNDSGTEIDYNTINTTIDLLRATNLSGDRIDDQNSEDNLLAIAEDFKGGNAAAVLQPIIAKWYVTLRDVALVGLLIVLVYLGIRMIISSSAEEQAKYKTMIKDWVIAVVVILMIHFIMSVLLTLTNLLIDVCDVHISVEGDELMNRVRTEIVHYRRTKELGLRFGYCMVYLVLIWYTIMFSWQYLKRTIYLAFLTVVAPLVGLTYPIDKVKDGQAQALNTWMREYIFNLMLQPVHLLVYKILVLMSVDLMEVNILYAVVAIGFLMEAESFIKKLFNFQSQGGGNSQGLAAGAMFGSMMTNMKKGATGLTNAMQAGVNGDSEASNSKVRLAGGNRTADSDAPKNLGAFSEGNVTGMNALGQNIQGLNSSSQDTSSGGGTRRRLSSSGGNGYSNTGGGSPGGGYSISANGLPSGQIPKLSNTTKEKDPSILSEIMNMPRIRGLARVRGRYLNLNTAKKASVLAARGLGAGVFGMIGIGAGLASDDYSNVFKMGALGFTTGAMLGKEATEQVKGVSKKAVKLGDTALKGALRR